MKQGHLYREVEITPRRETTFDDDVRSGRTKDDVELQLEELLDIPEITVDQQAARCKTPSSKASRLNGRPEKKNPIGRKNSAAYIQAVERGTGGPR